MAVNLPLEDMIALFAYGMCPNSPLVTQTAQAAQAILPVFAISSNIESCVHLCRYVVV